MGIDLVLAKKYTDKQVFEASGHTHTNKAVVDKLSGEGSNLSYDGVVVGSSIKTLSANESAPLGAELLDATGWTSEGWTGDFATGFTHTAGNTSPLSRSIGTTGTDYYLISFDVSDYLVANELTVQLGNSVAFDLYIGEVKKIYLGIQSVSDGDLIITPISGFNKTITNLSVKKITDVFAPAFKITDSAAGIPYEVRPTKESLYNLFLGKDSGQRNIYGHSNIGFGYGALKNNTTGFWNCAVGKDTLNANTTGSRNVAIGYAALIRNISGQRNQVIGSFAMQNNTTGNKNVAIGSDTLDGNTTGSSNVGIGFATLYKNTTGSSNIAIGEHALSQNVNGNFNIAMGVSALTLNTSGEHNIAIGNAALSKNTTASYNIGIGLRALTRTTTGNKNVAIGIDSMFYNVTGAENVAIGYTALYKNTGNYNTVIGTNGLYHNEGGIWNTAIGYKAGHGTTGASNSKNTLIGFYSGFALTSGGNNVLVGCQTGDNLTTGHDNIMIGYNMDAPAVDTSNLLNIGNTIIGDLSTKKLTLQGGLNVASLPTSDPSVAGDLWLNNGSLAVSAGA